jgi:hypothetical protein
MQLIFWVAEGMLAFDEGLCSMELISLLICLKPVKFMTCNRKVADSNLGPDTDSAFWGFDSFPHSVYENAEWCLRLS